MKRGIEQYNTSKFIFNPKKEGEFERLRSLGFFDFGTVTWSEKGLATWIALMYDPHSELRKEIKNYPERKAVAADLCGFNRPNDNKFADRLEHYIVGGNKKFNDSVIHYISKSNDRIYVTLCVKEAVYTMKLAESLTNYSRETHELTTKLLAELKDMENSLFGGDEVKQMREALYASGEAVRAKLRREDIVNMSDDDIKEFSPYGKDYDVENITYAGD